MMKRGSQQSFGLVVLLVLFSCMSVSTADAQISVDSFTTSTTSTQAGGHPDLYTQFTLADPGQPESARDVTFQLPAGVFGNPNAVPRCTSTDFALSECESSAQVGLITVWASLSGDPSAVLGTAPIYDMETQGDDEAARFALNLPTLDIPVSIPVSVRTASDYGLDFRVAGITQLAPLAEAKLTFWGIPADPIHNGERFPKGSTGDPAGCPGSLNTACIGVPTEANVAARPLINNPTRCTGSTLTTVLEVLSYQDPDPSKAESSYPEVTGCERGTFRPSLQADVTTHSADSPSGLDLEMRATQELGAAVAPSQIRSVVVTLPPGLTINPDAADGQTACSDAAANFGADGPANCPNNAKIGTFALGSPALDGPLQGSVYFGQPVPGNQYRLFMVADGFGVHAKLKGEFFPDPTTGQLEAEFKDLPQVPFESIAVHLFASDRGLLATPTHCTVNGISARFTPWNESLPDQTSTQYFGIESGPGGRSCPGQSRPFNPRLVAGTSTPLAGAFSAFTLRLDRDDGDQFLKDLNFRMPPGFTGSLRGITYCPESSILAASQNEGRLEQLSPSCPSSSQIGTTNVAAGPGEHPFHAVGQMYLSGPFKGARLSLAAITPALAGPYDYGVVVVRVALHVDPRTAQVTALSDTVPSIIGGVPIRMRSIQVNIDRPHFTINPTNCSPFSVDSRGIGDQGAIADFSSYFHAANCYALPFKPRMTIKKGGGRKNSARGKNPLLHFRLRTRPGDTNIRALSVTLPKAFQIDQGHLSNICSKSELASKLCKGRQAIGRVSVSTPLLDEPLRGEAYAVSGYEGLPHVVFILDGQVLLMPEGQTKTTRSGRLKTTIPVIPDAPIGDFHFRLFGGKQGYLRNTRNLCSGPTFSAVRYIAQNGRTSKQRIKLQLSCSRPRKGHKR